MPLSTDWPSDVDRKVYDELDSTSAEATRIAPVLAGPTWIMARKQTAGRGRRGRIWMDPPGNFAATLVLPTTETPDQVALRSFVASLAFFDAVVAVTGHARGLTLKWPNDVLLNGGKLGGILLESLKVAGQGSQQGSHRGSHLAIGIGVNLIAAPAPENVEKRGVTPVSLLGETGTDVTQDDFLDQLAIAYSARESQFTTYGFAPIREVWLTRAARIGEQVTARTGTTEIAGIFETIDAAGMLVLSTAKGRRAIPAAEVFF